MKIFNVLFPYPDALPLGRGDESVLTGFFDGMTQVDKFKDTRDCLPAQLRENIAAKQQSTDEEAIKQNEVENI